MYSYKVEGRKGLEPYSGGFKTEEDAIKWYNKKGKELEEIFNRKLILTES